MIFAFLGLWGSYLLLRQAFYLSRTAAICGAGIFLFNGFFAHRMLIGHLGYCHFMLIPLVAYLVLKPLPPNKNGRLQSVLLGSTLGGLLLAAAVQSEFVITIIPAVLAIVLVGAIHGWLFGNFGAFLVRLGAAGSFGILLSLSRLTAIVYLLKNFPRNVYTLPGADGIWEAASVILRALIISPAHDPSRQDAFTNLQFFLGRHEWEYSLSPIPFLFIVIGLVSWIRKVRCLAGNGFMTGSRFGLLALIALLLLLPVGLNSYYPAWNAFLKQLPVIGSSSSLIRWVILYIPAIALLAALAVEHSPVLKRHLPIIPLAGLAAVAALNYTTDRSYYHAQKYDPTAIMHAFERVRSGAQSAAVHAVMVYRDSHGVIRTPGNRNDVIALGGSQLYCYEPLFGYWLESFPQGALQPGPITAIKSGRYNLKNPACYLWPQTNQCRPGDHFKVSQKKDLNAFAAYQPYAFQMPVAQIVANWVNGCALIAAALFLGILGLRRFLKQVLKPAG